MVYNVHPMVVHFPVALLFLYSIIKILPFYKWFPGVPSVSWKHTERVLLLVGALGALVAIFTGWMAISFKIPDSRLLQMHAIFAITTGFIYGTLLLVEAISIFSVRYAILADNIFFKILPCIGLITLIITGMLGGVMVHGLSADPLTPFVLKLLGIYL